MWGVGLCIREHGELPSIETRLEKEKKKNSMWRLCVREHGELPCIETRLKKPVCGGYVAGNMGVALHRGTTEEDSVGCLCIWERGEFALYGGTAEESNV